jgi:tRNA threonylcarbamoyladenosine modification (KEOPS) complex Cgi121 subunit
MLSETIEWKDEVIQVGMSEFKNSAHLNRKALLTLASSKAENVLAVQFFDSSMIVDELHLLSAVQNAVNAWRGGYMKSRGLDVEMIVYASAQHQIGRALELMGVTDGTEAVLVVVLGAQLESVKECTRTLGLAIGKELTPAFRKTLNRIKALMKVFNISDSEVALFLTQHDKKSWQRAVSKCLVSRISQVAVG